VKILEAINIDLLWYLFREVPDKDLAVLVQVEESSLFQKLNMVANNGLYEAFLECLRSAGERIVRIRTPKPVEARRRYPQRD